MTPQTTPTVTPTDDPHKARDNLDRHGYCLLSNALSDDQVAQLRARLRAQAQAEEKLGDAFEDGGPTQQWGSFIDDNGRVRAEAFRKENGGVNQRLWMLVNKGQAFVDLLGPSAARDLVHHVLGDEMLLSSYTANIARPGGIAMALHTDQWWMPAPTHKTQKGLPVGSITRSRFDTGSHELDAISPAACANIIWLLDDFTHENGATRVVPGSHLAGRHPDKELDANAVAEQACAPAGTALITDGRVWHGTGANVANTDRHAVLTTFCGPQFRPQENFVAGTRQEVVDTASHDILSLLGFKVWWGYGRTGHPTVDMIDRNDEPTGELGD